MGLERGQIIGTVSGISDTNMDIVGNRITQLFSERMQSYKTYNSGTKGLHDILCKDLIDEVSLLLVE